MILVSSQDEVRNNPLLDEVSYTPGIDTFTLLCRVSSRKLYADAVVQLVHPEF